MIYYKEITYISILRKDNWRHGGNASTFMSDKSEGGLWMEVNMYGRTKEESWQKLMKFLSGNGEVQIKLVK